MVLRVEGEVEDKNEVLFFSKILRIEGENFERNFLVDDKYSWVFLGGDDSCWTLVPKKSVRNSEYHGNFLDLEFKDPNFLRKFKVLKSRKSEVIGIFPERVFSSIS